MIACKEALAGASYITAVSVLDLPIGAKIRRDADVAGIDCVDNGRRFRRGALQYARLAVVHRTGLRIVDRMRWYGQGP